MAFIPFFEQYICVEGNNYESLLIYNYFLGYYP